MDPCPVCLNETNNPVETNCGHIFCGSCIIIYWQHGSWNGPMPCPVCRQRVSIILQCFRSNSDSNCQLIHDINDYNRRFSGEPRSWLDYIYDLPILLRHMASEFFSVGGFMYIFRIRVVLCMIAVFTYLISPLDMIPEAVFGFLGLFDDLFVLFLVTIYITIVYRRYLADRWQEED